MIELLVVLAILGVLVILFLMTFRNQVSRSRDSRRKGDLEKIKIAFEEYYNDNGCYPDPTILDQCLGDQLKPYMSVIPCDPMTNQPYEYIPMDSDQCGGYRVLTDLEDNKDPVIEKLGCSPDCGFGAGYNYGIAVGTGVAGDVVTPSPSPGVSPSPGASPSGPVYVYACDRNGECNQYSQGHPFLVNCPITWPTPEQCLAADCKVAHPEYRCN